MPAIDELTPQDLQIKITSKEIVIETLSKKANNISDDLNFILDEILKATSELATLNDQYKNIPSSQDTVTDKKTLPLPTTEPAQPESTEDH